MGMAWQDVINGSARWSVEAADCIAWLDQLPADSVDLMVFSPPYEAARTYGIDFKLRGEGWVTWMVKVFESCRRVCKGLVACVCEGQTRGYRWSAVPALLMADLHRAGFHVRHPVCFAKTSAIPGGGGASSKHRAAGGSADWWRNDWEFVVCATRGGALPWADALAVGHTPKWAPGGEMSNRLSDGTRVNQWGHPIESGATVQDEGGSVTCKGRRPSHRLGRGNPKGSILNRDKWGGTGHATGAEGRHANGQRKTRNGRRVVRGTANGDTLTSDSYDPPAVANPGNIIRCKVGGGHLGHVIAHKNEAPYPLALAERFVRCFCPPDGIVSDCFAGSGTTAHAAIEWGRRFIGADIRESQVALTKRRLATVQPRLFNGATP